MNAKRTAGEVMVLAALLHVSYACSGSDSEPPGGTDVGAGGDALPGMGGSTSSTGGVPSNPNGGAPTIGGTANNAGADPGMGGAPGGAGAPAMGGTAGAPGSAGGGSAGAPENNGGNAGSAGAPPTNGSNTAAGYENLAPPLLTPLDPANATALTPAAPAGWSWFPIEGTQCRDGSGTGMFVRFTDSDKLLIYFEGGGACSNNGYCNFNPPNIGSVLSGNGETVLGTALGVVPGRQQPGVFEGGVIAGIFDNTNAANPFQNWNMVYIPYCTGDVHFGTNESGTVPGLATPQKFVGYRNTQKFVGHIVPTFKDKVDYVMATGASAGSFGAALNYSMMQDAFGEVRVDLLLDSGVPFTDQYMPTCMQKRWRDSWGLNAALPPDCTECFHDDGGGLINLADFMLAKHPNTRLAAISTDQDEIIRLFFSVGLSNCANYDTADPVGVTIGQLDPNVYYPGPNYSAGMGEVKDTYSATGRLATYLMPGTLHQHTWRNRFYQPVAGGVVMAEFVKNFMDGNMQQIAP